jgi:hypothetical protein
MSIGKADKETSAAAAALVWENVLSNMLIITIALMISNSHLAVVRAIYVILTGNVVG